MKATVFLTLVSSRLKWLLSMRASKATKVRLFEHDLPLINKIQEPVVMVLSIAEHHRHIYGFCISFCSSLRFDFVVYFSKRFLWSVPRSITVCLAISTFACVVMTIGILIVCSTASKPQSKLVQHFILT